MPSETRSVSERLIIHRLAKGGDSNAFAADVYSGLSSKPKMLPPKYFYDDLGSALFEAICRLPEYYLTRAESELLRDYSTEIVNSIEPPVNLIELGSGSAEKTRYLIEAWLRRQQELHYLPIDISDVSLERSSAELLHSYPRLRITAYAADYFTALGALAKSEEKSPRRERAVVLFLGSNIGNFNPVESRAFLLEVRKVLHPGDVLLMGADLRKSRDILEPAYDDSLGVTAAFNLNLLVRINRELGGEFDVHGFQHKAVYNERLGRVEIHLISRAAQSVHIRDINLEAKFDEGESIQTENSYKFDIEQLDLLARETGFSLEKTWFDRARSFSFNLFIAV